MPNGGTTQSPPCSTSRQQPRESHFAKTCSASVRYSSALPAYFGRSAGRVRAGEDAGPAPGTRCHRRVFEEPPATDLLSFHQLSRCPDFMDRLVIDARVNEHAPAPIWSDLPQFSQSFLRRIGHENY